MKSKEEILAEICEEDSIGIFKMLKYSFHPYQLKMIWKAMEIYKNQFVNQKKEEENGKR